MFARFLPVLLVVPALRADLPPSAAVLDEISPAMQKYMASGDISGAVTVVGRSDGFTHVTPVGFRDLEVKKPMEKETLFRIASMTKPITAIGNGALWQVDGGLPQSSGAIVSGLAAGNHTVGFLPASGWTTPANQTVNVSQNQTNTTTGTYTLPNPPYFVSSSLGWSTNGFRGLVSNSSGIAAIVQSSSNLLSWQNVYTNAGSFLFLDSGASYINQQYYRLIIP